MFVIVVFTEEAVKVSGGYCKYSPSPPQTENMD